jgi:hypothetical protein
LELNKYLKEKKNKEIEEDVKRSIYEELGIVNTDEDDITKKTRRYVKFGPMNVLEMIEKNKEK